MDFKISWPSRGHDYTNNEINLLSEFLNNNSPLTQSENVLSFENSFGNYIKNKNSIALMSAAHALDLIAKRIKSLTNKNKILIPAHTYCATALSFIREGFKVKFIDIDPNTFVVNNEIIKNNIDEDVAAVVVVHLYGLVSNQIKDISETCKENKIFLVEDCAQSFGGFNGKIHCGNYGDYSCFSFHSQKNITTLGEGGMLVCKRNEEVDIFKEIRINGHRPFIRSNNKYWKPAMIDVVESVKNIVPMKSTMNESQAIIGLSVLNRYSKIKEYRRKLAKFFYDELNDFKSISFQQKVGTVEHANHLLPIKFLSKKINRDKIIEKLSNDYKIQAIVQFYPLNRYDFFKNQNTKNDGLVNTNNFFDNMLSLPFSATITFDDADYMIDSVKKIIKNV